MTHHIMNIKHTCASSIFCLCLLAFSGCNSTESTLAGGAIGTALGSGVGYAIGGSGGAVLGGVVGGLGGGALGHHVGKENEKQQANNQQQNTTTYASRTTAIDDYELKLMRNEIEKQRLINEKLRLEKEREMLNR